MLFAYYTNEHSDLFIYSCITTVIRLMFITENIAVAVHSIKLIYVISKENKLLSLTHHNWKNVTAYIAKCTTFSSDWRYVAFLHTLTAVKRTGGDVWQMECQASNVTANVQSDHLLYGYILLVFFTTDQLHRPPRCGEIQPMSSIHPSILFAHKTPWNMHVKIQENRTPKAHIVTEALNNYSNNTQHNKTI